MTGIRSGSAVGTGVGTGVGDGVGVGTAVGVGVTSRFPKMPVSVPRLAGSANCTTGRPSRTDSITRRQIFAPGFPE